jgi:hypothetical protein
MISRAETGINGVIYCVTVVQHISKTIQRANGNIYWLFSSV